MQLLFDLSFLWQILRYVLQHYACLFHYGFQIIHGFQPMLCTLCYSACIQTVQWIYISVFFTPFLFPLSLIIWLVCLTSDNTKDYIQIRVDKLNQKTNQTKWVSFLWFSFSTNFGFCFRFLFWVVFGFSILLEFQLLSWNLCVLKYNNFFWFEFFGFFFGFGFRFRQFFVRFWTEKPFDHPYI